jgi:hypothetical protein
MSLPSIVNKNTSMDDSNFVKTNGSQNTQSTQQTTKGGNGEGNGNHNIPFWTEDPNILFNKEYVFEFYPTPQMSYYQKLNTVTRVVILTSILLFFASGNPWVLVVAGIVLFSIFILYKNDKKEIAKKNLLEGYENPAQVYLKENNKVLPPNEEVFEEPTTKNPFSNILIPEYEYNPNRKGAPPISNEIVNDIVLQRAKDLIQEQNPNQPNISDKLFKSLNDEFDFEQSLRPFYSTANTTIPNDQGGFADFCYGSAVSCKEGNLFACARNMSHYTLY